MTICHGARDCLTWKVGAKDPRVCGHLTCLVFWDNLAFKFPIPLSRGLSLFGGEKQALLQELHTNRAEFRLNPDAGFC